MADFANGGEPRLCPRWFGMVDVAWTWYRDVRGERWWRTWVVRGGGGNADQRESLNAGFVISGKKIWAIRLV
ncbi:hypothetical protein ES319_A10G135500v1 [Gossypium barbadense]|uniref:Uncharacterized protein n=2 Tax=Gossypium TaxID=3633 RepID=A0A5J5U2F8_GOSBA|nr:hypothetical protein ES319_A10G135500v1 [Gossypium barbadense]TYG98850.1 hypothetical protein ES288_A10G149900v1 [Gossypium darwinii]